MKKTVTCIECPVGCRLEAEIDASGTIKVLGNKCAKGYAYAVKELTSPERFQTSTVKAEGLEVKRVPVRTDSPVPKGRIKDVMDVLEKTVIVSSIEEGDIVAENVLGLGANIIATRSYKKPAPGSR